MIGVIDADSNVISCSDTSLIGEKWPEAVIPAQQRAGFHYVVVDKKTFKPLVSWSAYFDYAVFAGGDDEIAKACASWRMWPSTAQRPTTRRSTTRAPLSKNIITDNILPRRCLHPCQRAALRNRCAARRVPDPSGRQSRRCVCGRGRRNVSRTASRTSSCRSTRPILPSSSRFSPTPSATADQDRPDDRGRRCTRSCSSRPSSASAP